MVQIPDEDFKKLLFVLHLVKNRGKKKERLTEKHVEYIEEVIEYAEKAIGFS